MKSSLSNFAPVAFCLSRKSLPNVDSQTQQRVNIESGIQRGDNLQHIDNDLTSQIMKQELESVFKDVKMVRSEVKPMRGNDMYSKLNLNQFT